MNLEKKLYTQINKNFQALKTMDAFTFNQELNHFCLNNARIENLAQLDEFILLIEKCQNYNLIVFTNALDKLLIENLFFKKMLSVYYKNQDNLNHEINESIQKFFIIIYHENKNYILINENELTSFLKESNEVDITTINNEEKQKILINLLNYSAQFKVVKQFADYLNKQKVIIETLIELLKII